MGVPLDLANIYGIEEQTAIQYVARDTTNLLYTDTGDVFLDFEGREVLKSIDMNRLQNQKEIFPKNSSARTNKANRNNEGENNNEASEVNQLGAAGIKKSQYTIPENKKFLSSLTERSAFILAKEHSIVDGQKMFPSFGNESIRKESNSVNGSLNESSASYVLSASASTPQHTAISLGMSSLSIRAPFATPGAMTLPPRVTLSQSQSHSHHRSRAVAASDRDTASDLTPTVAKDSGELDACSESLSKSKKVGQVERTPVVAGVYTGASSSTSSLFGIGTPGLTPIQGNGGVNRMSIDGGNVDNSGLQSRVGISNSVSGDRARSSISEINDISNNSDTYSAGALSVSPATAAAIAATLLEVQEEESLGADVYARFGGVYDDEAAVAAVTASLLLESAVAASTETLSTSVDRYIEGYREHDNYDDDLNNSSNPPLPKVMSILIIQPFSDVYCKSIYQYINILRRFLS